MSIRAVDDDGGMGSLTWQTILETRGRASAIVLTDEQVATIGEGARRFSVVATVNGYTWTTVVTRMGGENLLGLSRAVRTAASVEIGDHVEVTVTLEKSPSREVELPGDFAAALKRAGLTAAFADLAYTHRKEYVRWIEEAKKAETRENRIVRAVEMIRDRRTRS